MGWNEATHEYTGMVIMALISRYLIHEIPSNFVIIGLSIATLFCIYMSAIKE